MTEPDSWDRVPTSLLCARDVPAPSTPWEEAERFALTYNGYGRWGDATALANVAKRVGALIRAGEVALATEDELRGLLFFEQRAARHAGGEPEPAVLTATLEELARRLPPRPVVDPNQPAFDGLPVQLLGAMVDGIRDQAAVITTAATRVAPENAVVLAAALGLRRYLFGRPETVLVEKQNRTDLLVTSERATWAFEWKTAWERGFGENVGGIRDDRAKLAKHESRGAVLAFCYAVREPECDRSAREPLATTVQRFEGAPPKGVGPAVLRSEPFVLADCGVVVDAQVLVWAPA